MYKDKPSCVRLKILHAKVTIEKTGTSEYRVEFGKRRPRIGNYESEVVHERLAGAGQIHLPEKEMLPSR